MIKDISSLLFYANDIGKTFDFYRTLGFAPTKRRDMITLKVGQFQVDFIDKRTAKIKKGADLEPKGLGMFLYVEVDDVDKFYKFALSKGVKPSSEPTDWEWGNREFVIKDPNGYRLVFFNKTKK